MLTLASLCAFALAIAVGVALRTVFVRTNRELDALARRSERAERWAALPAELERTQRQLDLVLEISPGLVWNVDADLRFVAFVGRQPRVLADGGANFVGRFVDDVFAHVPECDVVVAAHRRAIDGFAARCALETAGRRFDLHLQPQRDDRGRIIGALGVCLDLTAHHSLADAARSSAQALARAQAEARTDPLTGLPNRHGLLAQLGSLLAEPRAPRTCVAVLFIEVACPVDDMSGFAAGDDVARPAAQRLVACTGRDGFVARFGGEGFVVVLPSAAGPGEAGVTARTILEAFARPLSGTNGDIYCTASIGIDCSTDRPSAPDELIRNAGTAMLAAKSRGRNFVAVYTPALRETALDRGALERDLRGALERGELRVHYQPIVAATGRVLRFEALMRWMHPTRGLVPPSHFIAHAEACGLIVPLGAWVIERACRDMVGIRKRFPGAGLAVNVSPRQLQTPGFEQHLRDVLARTHTDPRSLEIEITETMIMSDIPAVLPGLVRLRASGISISLDDFGTGYSSLAYLKRLPVDTLKIDQSFVRDISIDQLDGAIARTIVKLAHGLGLRVAAEGVETEIQRSYLEHVRCDQLQGFLFSEPLPPPEVQLLSLGATGVFSGATLVDDTLSGGLRFAAST